MNSVKTNIQTFARKGRAVILLGMLAALVATVGCSKDSPVTSAQPVSAKERPATLETVVPVSSQPAAVAVETRKPVKRPSKLVAYRSRDYGVSFLYPWQYAHFSARAIAQGDSSLRPKSDGHDGQFPLVRIEIPKGFYPDTNFDSGYFTLSLNQELDQPQCESSLTAGEDEKVQTETVNGVDFRWIETDSGGGGNSAKRRNYVNFSNGTCYELEMGVKTKNEQGLAREVDPDQVLRRLEAILRTVKIQPEVQVAAQPVEGSTEEPPISQ